MTARWLVVGALAVAPHSAQSPQAPAIAIVDVSVIPVRNDGVLLHQTVLIRDGRVAAMGSSTSVRPPKNAQLIDGRGQFLLPGLVDAHVHLEEEADFAQFVAAGVTTVRDLMGSEETLAWRTRIASGALLGPRIVTAGPLFAGPQVPWRNKFVTESPDSARAEVRRQHTAGYDLVKIYDGLTADVYAAVVDEAKKLGVSTTGHIPSSVHLAGVLAAKQNLEHTDKILHDVWRDRFDSTRVDSVAQAIAAAGVFVTPTIATMQQFSRVSSGKFDSLLARPEARRAGPVTVNIWCKYTARLRGNRPQQPNVRYDRYADAEMQIIAAERRAGVPLVAGTDYPNAVLAPGSGLIEEMIALRESGLSNAESIRAATMTAGLAIGDTTSGIVAVGARADLIMVAANPLTDLGALSNVQGVVLNGRWLSKAALDSVAPLRPPPTCPA